MAERAVVQVLLGEVTKLLIAEVAFLKGVKEQIKQLQRDLEWMVLEVKEATENRKSDETSKLYAKQMRDIIFDAEDVIDKFMIKIVDHKRHPKDSKALTGLNNIINTPFQHGLGSRIGKINARVEKLRAMEKHRTMCRDTESSNRSLSLQQRIKERRAQIFKEIRGRDPVQMYEGSARQVIKSLLMGDEGGNNKMLRIISIIGMGGVGKTTLCHKVFNDRNVMKQFKCRAFVYISEVYSLPDLLKRIMKSSGSDDSDGEMTCEKVRAHLEIQKYLIVLDDIWDTNVWEELRGAFPDANNGSRVLITTRHKYVAVDADKCSISTNNIHEMSAINNEKESWELFLKNYRPYSSGLVTKAYFNSNIILKDLGERMVNKCHGLPLAIVVLGDLLSVLVKKESGQQVGSVWSRENLRSSWLLCKGNDSYKCPGILALSYDYLPYHLKPCFLYMSLFPDISKIRVTKLFQYWIAEGFVSTEGEQAMEDAAEAYLDELICRSLIQVSKRRADGRVKTCHIHGILRGISVSESTEDEFSQIYGSLDEFNRKQNSSRRVAVYCNEQNEQYFSGSRNTRIRSLMCDVSFPKKNYLSSLFGGFKSLRVLEFNGYAGMVSLPKEVGELVHLRYLSLEKTKLKKINTSDLSTLVNLQTLNLKGNIGHELVLDDQIWCLDQLRHLYLRNIQLGNSKKHWGIGYLKELQLLIIQAGDWINDGWLEKLSSLKKLKIEECLHSHSDKISTAVANLMNLRSLALKSKISSRPSITNEGVPLTSIKFSSHTYLTSLHLKGNMHGWSRDISFPPQLCKLKLEWSWITEDPMLILEKLPFLTFLHIGVVSYLGKQMVCSKAGFARLQTLELVSIENLENWIIKKGALTNLTKLEILGCKNLKKLPDGLQHLTKLEELRERMPHLRSRMAEKVGEDWHKIKHIPSRKILL
ncbi:hypothetical protein MKW94_014273 [Papaver nudicaule]|uniref:Uncharacterized protein n=1 Tax=Papaver nudicaule TaxID=74823 RepID=A0AA41RPV8_PAPNU|nr:hypothetical protein [Papaver nudicaule]